MGLALELGNDRLICASGTRLDHTRDGRHLGFLGHWDREHHVLNSVDHRIALVHRGIDAIEAPGEIRSRWFSGTRP